MKVLSVYLNEKTGTYLLDWECDCGLIQTMDNYENTANAVCSNPYCCVSYDVLHYVDVNQYTILNSWIPF